MGKEQINRIATLEIKDMSGGLNSNPLSTKIEDNECRDAKNVVWIDSSIGKIPGFQLYSSYLTANGPTSTKKITGICDFQKRDLTQFLVVATEDDIYNFTTAPGTSIKGALTVSNALHSFGVFNDRLVATNYTNAPWTWNGAGNAVTLASLCGVNLPPANAKYIASFNSRLCLANYIDNIGAHRPTAVAFCALDNVLSWDLTYQTWEFETDDAQEITGVRQLKDKFVVYKDNSIGLVSGYGTQSWTVQRDFVRGVGCVSGHTVKTGYLNNGGALREVHIFLSQDGYKAFDGVNVYNLPINEQNDDYKCFEYFDSLNKAGFENAVGEFYRKRNWFIGFYPNSGSSTNDRGSIYDYQTNSLWPTVNIKASCASTMWNDTTKDFDVLIGTEDGRVLVMSEEDESIDDDTELITDGNMEAVGVTNWTSYNGGTRVKSVVTYFNGAQGLEIGSAGPGQGVEQNITTVVGERYRVYAWVISTAGAAGSWQLTALNGTTELTNDYVTHSAVTWTKGKIDFTATSTTTTIRIEDRRGAGGTMVADDVSCRNCDIDSYWESKDFDLGSEHDVKLLRELVPYANEIGNYNVQFTLTFDKGLSATTDNLLLLSGAAVWGEFVWGTVEWGGGEEIQDDLENLDQNAFRTVRIKFANTYGGQNFNINKILMTVTTIGKRWFHT